jgi:hypothetical protein
MVFPVLIKEMQAVNEMRVNQENRSAITTVQMIHHPGNRAKVPTE